MLVEMAAELIMNAGLFPVSLRIMAVAVHRESLGIRYYIHKKCSVLAKNYDLRLFSTTLITRIDGEFI